MCISGAFHGSWTVLDVNEDCLVAVCSAPNRPPTILVGHIPKAGSGEMVIIFLLIRVLYLMPFFIPYTVVYILYLFCLFVYLVPYVVF